MKNQVEFEEVIALFESHGWKLRRIQGINRVFIKGGERPWSIQVLNREVDVEYVKKFKEFLKERGEI